MEGFVTIIQLEGYIFPLCFTLLQRASWEGNKIKLDSESSTWKSGQHEMGGDHSVQPLALSSFAVPPKMDLICILMRKYHCSFRNIIRLICGGERGYLRRHPAPFGPKAEHSFVIKVIKMMFFNHLYAGTAAQVLVLQQEPRIRLRTHDVSCILTWTMDLCGLL